MESMKSETEIAALATEALGLENLSVSFLAEGFGNLNYLIETGNKKFVFRLKKSMEFQFSDSLEREYVFLKYFESQGIDFCPKVLALNKKENFLIESYLAGDEVTQADFTDGQIDELARNLQQLFHLDVTAFADFCEQNGYKKFTYLDPVASLKTYGFDRYEKAKQGDLPVEVMAWFEESLAQNLEHMTSFVGGTELGFSWGDIQPEVIVDSAGKMHLYDFEHACISNSFGLTYVKIHGTFSPSQLDYLVGRCAHHFGRNKDELLLDIIANEKVVRTNDAVWAAMKWTATKDRSFESQMYERIELVKKLDQ